MAEEVMLFFANEGVPVLPSHDSFTMHQGYQEDLQKVMGEVFRDRFGQEIGIKLECKMPYVEGDGEILSMSIEDILSGLEGDCDQRLELFRGS
jgi:hypothetical protein